MVYIDEIVVIAASIVVGIVVRALDDNLTSTQHRQNSCSRHENVIRAVINLRNDTMCRKEQ